MKKIFLLLLISGCFVISSCSDWLDLYPKNEQVTERFWKSKEDVEAVLASGYFYMRETCHNLIKWGELRGASIYYYGGTNSQESKLQNFQLIPSDQICNWASIYNVINMANSVIEYAPKVYEIDNTYNEGSMNSHLTEAYFMRALMNFYLVRNYKEVPLILKPYVDDSAPFSISKSSEEEIINQIKSDVETALNTNAAKEYFEDDVWLGISKGRATIWALYALMAEVSLWSEDYDKCVEYADYLINASSSKRPAFITIPERWFSIFNPGNSNESIFELNWDGTTFNQTSKSPSGAFSIASNASLQYNEAMLSRLTEETKNVIASGKDPVRDLFGAYIPLGEGGEFIPVEENVDNAVGCIWKYWGTEVQDASVTRTRSDANWIIYRMADVMLMKAEALIWKDENGWNDALDIMNTIRRRSNLDDLDVILSEMDEEGMLKLILHERDMEFAAEGKRWYDLVRFGKIKDYKYKTNFITMITENNTTANNSWIRSVLQNNYAWYLPIYENELEVNTLLVQNPYYEITE